MKQLLLHLSILFLISYNIQAQNLVNGGFEDWDDLAGGLYTQPTGWSSLNVLALLSAPQTVTKTTDAQEGSFAARLETKTFFGNLIAGLLYLGDFDVSQGINGVQEGIPFAGGRPERFTGWYKYESVNGDSAVVFAQLWRYNLQTGKRDTIAQAATSFLNSTTSYTQFEIDFTYYSSEQPDSVYVVLVSSGAGGEGQGQVGSTLFIDNVLFDYTTGIVPLFGTSVAVDVYPIPATHQLTVQLSEALHQASLEIYNLQSQLMLQTPLSDLQTQLDVSSLSAGAYTYRITAAGMPVKKGVVQIVK